MRTNETYDVIIIGGSYAGLSAAMALGRSLRKTLVIDSAKPCNRQTPHSHNFLTQDGKRPAEISAISRKQVGQYPSVSFADEPAVRGVQTGSGFEIVTESGASYEAAKLIFATGIQDLLPETPGLAACWGISVVHCPYCHGYEYRGKKTVLMANGERALHLAGLLRNLTDDVTVLSNGPAEFSEEQRAILSYHSIPLIETPVAEIAHEAGYLHTLVLADGTKLRAEVAYAAVPFRQHTDIAKKLGVGYTDQGHLKTDAFQKTCVRGIYACGDCANPMRSVAAAVASGNLAGAMVNHELTTERFAGPARPAVPQPELAVAENDCGC